MVGLNKYMEQQQSTLSWRSAKKEKKKGKGKKHKNVKEISSSDEDDIPVIHQVRGLFDGNSSTFLKQRSINSFVAFISLRYPA